MDDYIVKDSSIWRDTESFARASYQDNTIKIGIVRSASFNETSQEIFYIVEVQSEGDKLIVPCRVLQNIGGIYNYEETILRTYEFDETKDQAGAFETKAGDTVLVAFLNGDPREGIILGGLNHPGRELNFSLEDGVQYKRVINGLDEEINADGEYTVTFRGIPTNADILEQKPGNKAIPPAEYDEEIGTTFFKFDAKGGFTVSDNATENPQSIIINKAEGTITVTSGNIVLTMAKEDEATSLVTKTLNIEAEDSFDTATTKWATEASESAKLKSPKVAIGTDGIELLDQLVKLIDAVGAQTVITPVGPASPVSASPQWSQVTQIQQKINSIKGSL